MYKNIYLLINKTAILLGLVCFLCSNLFLIAQTELPAPQKKPTPFYEITIDLQKVERESVKVVMRPPDGMGKFQSAYSFALPASWGNNGIGIQHYLHHILPQNEKGKRIPHIYHSRNSIIIEDGDRLEELEYWVEDLIEKIPEKSTLPVAGVRIDPNFFMLYPSFFCGYWNERTDLPYKLRIIHPEAFTPSVEPSEKESETVDVFHFEDFYSLMEMPICYAAFSSHTFTIDSTEVELQLFDSSNKFKATYFAQIVSPLIKEAGKMMEEHKASSYRFSFLLDNQLRNSQRIPFGAQSLNNSSFYWLPLKGKRGSLRMLVEDQVAHELLHTFLPGALQSEKTSHPHSFSAGNGTQHLWLMEGVIEYLSLQILANAGSISEKELWRLWAAKIRHYYSQPSPSLLSITGNTKKSKRSASPGDLYNKGALLALCLDAQLLQENPDKNLLNLIHELIDAHPNHTFSEDSLFLELKKIGGNKLDEALNVWLIKNEKLPLKSILASMGLAYHETYYDTLYTFGRFKVTPDRSSGKFICKAVKENELGIEEGDALLSINGALIDSKNYADLLKQLRAPEKYESMELLVLRAGKELPLYGSAREDWQMQKYVLRSIASPTENQERARQRMGFR